MRNQTKLTITAVVLISANFKAIAQDETGFFATLDATLVHDDNIYRVTEDLAKNDSYLSIVPKLRVIGGIGKQRYELQYKGDYAKFAEFDDANYSDHDLKGRIDLEHSLRFSTNFEAGYQKEHEEPGSINRIQLNITEYNKFNLGYVLAGFAYGQDNSIGKISFNYRKTSKDYTNNSLDFLDYDSQQITTRFTYRIAPKTRIYIEALLSEFDYKPVLDFDLDNDVTRYRAGLSWDFTNKLTGDINVGYQDRDYQQESIQDINGIAYNGEINWSINSYTNLELLATRESLDSTLGEAGGFLRNLYSLSLNHELTELLKVEANAEFTTDELFINTSREDDRNSYSFAISYDLLRNVTVGVFYEYEERESTDILAEYKANIVGLNLIVSLDN